MDGSTVFVKTREGEAAVRSRARLEQRHLRNLLIMVDGRASVAELAARLGDADGMEASLAELAAAGLIEDAARITSGAVAADPSPEAIPVLCTPVADPAGRSVPPRPGSAFVMDMPEYESVPPPLAALPPRREGAAAKKEPGWVAAFGLRLAALVGRRGERRGKGRRSRHLKLVAPRPIRLGRRPYVHWSVLASLGLVGLALALLLAAWLFPYERYRPDIEGSAAAALGDPVTVGEIGFSLFPRPNLTLRDVAVGRERHFTAAAVRLTPDVLSLLGGSFVLRRMELDTVSLKGPGLVRFAGAGTGRAGAGTLPRHVTLKELRLEVGDAVWAGIGGEAELGLGGTPKWIRLRDRDGSLKLDVVPKGAGYRISLLGSKWTPPFAPRLTVDYLEAEGEWADTRLKLSKIDGKAYGGLIEGRGWLDWSAGAALAGELELKRLDLRKLLPELHPHLAGEGEISARLRLEGRAEALGRLDEALRAEAGFVLRRGALKGFDLVEAARVAGRVPTRGGTTRFEEFSGNLQLDRQAYRLTGLRLGSGPMKAAGQVDVGRDEGLNGLLEVELRRGPALAKVPVSIAGTLKEPLLTGRR